MNKRQYNNIIKNTLKRVHTEDSLSAARAVFKNMGVALPSGDIKEVFETVKTDNYMGWKSCTMEEAQAAANSGTAAIGISDSKIVVLAADDAEEPIEPTAEVLSITDSTSAIAVAGLQYYSYGYGGTVTSIYCSNRYLSLNQMTSNAQYILNYLRARGWTKNAVCGMLGNMQTESTINPGLWQNFNENNMNVGFGLVQWTPASKYIDWANRNCLYYLNIDSQLQRLLYEVNNGGQWYATSNYNMTFTQFTKSTKSVSYLAGAFIYNYERPGSYSTLATRQSQATYWYNNLI